MPRPTPPVKRGYYADDITVLAGVHDQQLPERCKHLPVGKLVFDLCAEFQTRLGSTRWAALAISTRSPTRWRSMTTQTCPLNCLEEDHVCHCITTQEPIPMKETLSWHHSTVLLRFGSSRLKNTRICPHTWWIQFQGNIRVLKERPPPISDEEQRLNRTQPCTLSQLRSGHSHLLQDYNHRALGEPSDICRDCGA